MQPSKILLALFVILTIAFATLSAVEYGQLTATKRTNQVSLPLISIGGAGFTYTEWNSSTPNTFTISNVKFALWTNATAIYAAGSCYGPVEGYGYGGYVITFPDGFSEGVATCTKGPNPSTTISLTVHVNPEAGLLIVPSTGAVYFLVSA